MNKPSWVAMATTERPSNAAINALLHRHRTPLARHDLSCPAKSLHWRNRSVGAELFRNACIQPLQIPTVFILEQIRQGADVPTFMDQHNPSSLMAEYLNAQGYHFPWGYIVENAASQGAIDAEPGALHWHFVPVQLWCDRLGDRAAPSLAARINDLAGNVYLRLEHCMPNYVQPAQRRPHDLFAFKCSSEDRDRARRWMADKLLPKILPRLLAVVASQTCLPGSCAMPPATAISH